MGKNSKRIESGRQDDNSESSHSAVEMSDLGAVYDPPIEYQDKNLPNIQSEYEPISALLGTAADHGYSLAGLPAIDPNAAAGYGIVPPEIPVSNNAPPAPAPVPVNVVPQINAHAGNMGNAAAAPLAVPAAQQAIAANANQMVQNQGVNPGAAQRSCLAEHWKAMAGVLFVGFSGAAGLSLYLARNTIWPVPPVNPAPNVNNPAPGAQSIKASTDFVSNGKPASTLEIDLSDRGLQSPDLHGFDVSTFKFLDPDENHPERRTSNDGVYNLDKGAKKLTFYRSMAFMGGDAKVEFTVDNPDTTSTSKTLNGEVIITFPRRPIVFPQMIDHRASPSQPVAVNVITGDIVTQGLMGKGQPAEKTTDDLDASSVTFTGVVILDPLDTTTKPTYANMNQTMTVPNQGTWTADAAGVVTFTPLAGFSDTPYPATYQIGDVKKRPSNVATVTLNEHIDDAIKAVEAFAATPDLQFWTAYETILIKRNPSISVQQWNEINQLARTYVRMHIVDAELIAAQTVSEMQFDQKIIAAIFNDWEMGAFDPQGNQTRAPFDRQYLWDTYIAPIDDKSTGLTAGRLGTRFVRLVTINRMLTRYLQISG